MKASLVGRWARAAVVCAAVGFGLSAHAALTAKSYITDGLIWQLDGIENVAYGEPHDSSATSWKDLVGGKHVPIWTNASFVDTGVSSSGVGGTGKITNSGGTGTDPATVSETWRPIFAAYTAAHYTYECAFNKTKHADTTPKSYETTFRSVFLLLGNNAYKFGTVDQYGGKTDSAGFSPNGSSSAQWPSKRITVDTVVGQHTLSCSQDELNCKIRFDDEETSTTVASYGACNNQHGIMVNQDYNGNTGLDGVYHSIRFYNRPLTADELAVNRAVDKVRYFGVDAATLTLPTGWAFEVSGDDVKLMHEASVTVSHPERGSVSVNGGSSAESATYLCEHNGEPVSVSLLAEPNEGFEFVRWEGGGLSVADRLKASVTADVSGDIVAVFRRIVRITACAYLREGLVGQWDGVENAGLGQPHNDAATTWIDLSGGGLTISKPTAAYFVDNGLLAFRSQSAIDAEANWKKSPAYTAFASGNYSIELAYDQHELMPAGTGTGYKNRAGLLTISTDAYWIGTMNNLTLGFNGSFGVDYTLANGVTMSITDPRGEHTISCSHHCVDGDKTAKLCFDESIATAQKNPAATIATARGLQIGGIGYWRTGNSTDATYLSLRFYDHALSDDERLLNRAIDRVRCFSEEPEGVPLPFGYKFDTTDGVRLMRSCAITVEPAEAGTIAVDGGEAKAEQTYWGDVCAGTRLSLVAEAAEGYAFAGWRADGLTDDQKLEPTLTADFTGPIAAIFRKTDGSDVRSYTWSGTAADRLDNPKLWHDADGLPGVPAAFDNVTIPSATAATLTNATPVYGTVTVGGTLVMRDWTAKLAAADVTVANGGVIKPEGPFGNEEMSNRVWIVCGNLTVAAGGKINADLCGYKGKNGPGGGTSDYQAGSHGGKAGVGPGVPYGSLEEPETAGSGGGMAARSGGGIVRIDASGAVRMDGTVTANGSANVVWKGGGGAGGSVWINCRTIDGTGSVFANGGDRDGLHVIGWHHGGGGGGRISVRYDASAQAAKDSSCAVRFEARGGDSGYDGTAGRRTTGYSNVCGGLGSLYFTDNRFLASAAYRAAGWKFSGVWHSGEEVPDSFEFADDFRLENCWLDFGKEGIDFDFHGNLLVTGKIARISRLMLTDADVTVKGDLTIGAGGGLSIDRGSLTVGGDLKMDGAPATALRYGSELDVTAGPTNAPNAYGFELKVGGDLKLGKYASLFVDCCSSNGAIAKITAANVDIATNAVVNAQEAGWGFSLGYGAGGGSGYTGAAYGGFGGTHVKGKNKRTYGRRRSPFDPGSSSGNVRGGGVIYINTPGKMSLCGTVNASSCNQWNNWYAGGSGGSVYLNCRKLLPSTGTVKANGGAGGHVSSAGGGGRIAIYANEGSTNGMTITSSKGVMQEASAYGANYDDATDGTVYWKQKTGLRIFVR